jgi:hypothetical protein
VSAARYEHLHRVAVVTIVAFEHDHRPAVEANGSAVIATDGAPERCLIVRLPDGTNVAVPFAVHQESCDLDLSAGQRHDSGLSTEEPGAQPHHRDSQLQLTHFVDHCR